jgi:hypothetical protein
VKAERKRLITPRDHARRKAEPQDQNRPYIIAHNPNGAGSVKITDKYVVDLVKASDLAASVADQVGWQMEHEGRTDHFLCSYPATTSKDALEALLDLLNCCDWVATVEEPGILSVRPIKSVEAQQ